METGNNSVAQGCNCVIIANYFVCYISFLYGQAFSNILVNIICHEKLKERNYSTSSDEAVKENARGFFQNSECQSHPG